MTCALPSVCNFEFVQLFLLVRPKPHQPTTPPPLG